MGLVRISKEFRWEMGHRLPYHQGGCANVHGHSYRLVVELLGPVDSTGMVSDYGDISKVIKPILAELDHAYMVDPSDGELKSLLREMGLKLKEVGFFSTAENIASYLCDLAAPALASPGVKELVFRVHETHSTMAEVVWRPAHD